MLLTILIMMIKDWGNVKEMVISWQDFTNQFATLFIVSRSLNAAV